MPTQHKTHTVSILIAVFQLDFICNHTHMYLLTGYIRSYWNNNPDPEISRHLFDACGSEPVHKAIPSCATHLAILNR